MNKRWILIEKGFDYIAVFIAGYYIYRHFTHSLNIAEISSGILYIVGLLALSGLWRKRRKNLYQFLGVAFIIALAWHGFLYLVDAPPMDTTPALIMVWASVIILFLGMYPQVLDRIKKIKIKDFEIELQEAIQQVSEEEFISNINYEDDLLVSKKGRWRNLQRILLAGKNQPEIPQLLVVNLHPENFISIPMLFIYIIFMENISMSTIVLFVSTLPVIRSINEIRTSQIVGVVSGKEVLLVLKQRFPGFTRFFKFIRSRKGGTTMEDDIPSRPLLRSLRDDLLGEMLESNEPRFADRPERLTETEVRHWFSERLCRISIGLDRKENIINKIKQAINNNETYIIITDMGYLQSVGRVCNISLSITKSVLSN